jgi:hypothetical protein
MQPVIRLYINIDVRAAHVSIRLLPVSEHFPQGDTVGPDIRFGCELQVLNTFRRIPFDWYFALGSLRVRVCELIRDSRQAEIRYFYLGHGCQ